MPANPTFPHRYLSIEVSPETVAEKKRRGLCVLYRCRRYAQAGKNQCPTCRSRLCRLRDPGYYAFQNLKVSARKRGILFLLTRAEFDAFCERTGYLQRRGITAEALTIDRIDHHGPYSADNIRTMCHADNCRHTYETTDPVEF